MTLNDSCFYWIVLAERCLLASPMTSIFLTTACSAILFLKKSFLFILPVNSLMLAMAVKMWET